MFVEYAKESPRDLLIRISIHNRGPDPSRLDVLPTLWFRNEWSWPAGTAKAWRCGSSREMRLARRSPRNIPSWAVSTCIVMGMSRSFSPRTKPTPSGFSASPMESVCQGWHQQLCRAGQQDAVNPEGTGTKASAHYQLEIGPGGYEVINLRLTETGAGGFISSLRHRMVPSAATMRRCFALASRRPTSFMRRSRPPALSPDEALVMRQALAGMLWSKQFYHYDVDQWLEERGSGPYKPNRKAAPRNEHWHHMYNGDVISMPDKWEYPWYAAWDLAFHVLPLSLVDPDFGKQQLELMLREHYMHPNGQIPAYEWNFGDVNPPVHAWATIFTYRLEKAQSGQGDKEWLKSSFRKLLLNFTWWVNRKDRSGRNVFEGGFLGLDNIGVFDRSAPLPTGGYLEQADGTAWMALLLPEHARDRDGTGPYRT